jgi:hypothetical protein
VRALNWLIVAKSASYLNSFVALRVSLPALRHPTGARHQGDPRGASRPRELSIKRTPACLEHIDEIWDLLSREARRAGDI